MAAEAGLLLGIVAAAAQFTEIACRLLLHTSTLYSRFQSVPRYFQRTLNQIRLLLQLADRVSQRNLQQSIHRGTSPSSRSQQIHESVSLSWQENVWKTCTAHAQDLESIVTAMICETEDSSIRRVWKKVLTLRREERIHQIMNEIESYKTMLSVWYGQECLENIDTMRQEIVGFQGAQIANLTMEVKAMRSDMKALSKSRVQINQCGSAIQEKQNHQQRYASLQRECATTTISSFSFDEIETFCKPVKSCFNCMLRDWKRLVCYGSSWLSLRYSTAMRGDCPMHLCSSPSSEVDARLRIRIGWLSGAAEIAILLRWESGKPSIGFSLRAESRVRDLALASFFRGLYETRLWERKVVSTTPRGGQMISHVPVSMEKQNYLFSVARKMLIQVYQSGTASPYDTDSQGRTILHLQVRGSPDGHETFRTQMIRLLLSMGVRADALDDKFCTAQQKLAELCRPQYWQSCVTLPGLKSQINHTLIEWAPGILPEFKCAIDILDCALRWPESIPECGYPQICDIVIRRSVHDLEVYVSRSLHLKERTSRRIELLHFAAALNWSQGIEVLLAHGVDRYAQDSCNHFAVDLAIKTQSVEAVESLLRGDCMPYLTQKTEYVETMLRSNFLADGLHGNEELQNVVVKALARHRHELQTKSPYYDLAQNYEDSNEIAGKLFKAGFHNIEDYDEEGMTPLIRACYLGNISMITFLLQKGADPSSTHRDAALTAGHFLSFEAERFWRYMWHSCMPHRCIEGKDLNCKKVVELLQCAFDIAGYVESTCRCSPEGYSPLTSTFKADSIEHYFVRRQSFEILQRHLNLSQTDLRKQWRGLVRMEIFSRLELTHTCIRQFPIVRKFPEEDRLEIEDEEEEPNLQLEELMKEYDEWEQSFNGDIADCVDTFFDRLDQNLRPNKASQAYACLWQKNDPDILGPGMRLDSRWISSRGDPVYQDHREGVQESYMLRSLFD